MPTLDSVKAVVPSADTIAGRVIAYHNGKHYDLGEYVGEGVVVLSKDGEAIMATSVPVTAPKKASGKHSAKLNLDDVDL